MINCKKLAETNNQKSAVTTKAQSSVIDLIPEREDNHAQFGSSKRAGLVPAIFLHMAEEAPAEPKKPASIFKGRKTERKTPRGAAGGKSVRKLTIAEKAEIAALYRTGSFTIDDLVKKFGKSKVTIAKVIRDMGVKKGDAAEEAAKKLVEAIEHRTLTDTEETLRKIAKTRDEHFGMANGLARLAWSKIVKAEKAGLDIASLKEVMATLKLAGDVIGNARKELFTVLDVERFANEEKLEDLPELTVRELTKTEIGQLQNQADDDIELGEGDLGADMLPEDLTEGS